MNPRLIFLIALLAAVPALAAPDTSVTAPPTKEWKARAEEEAEDFEEIEGADRTKDMAYIEAYLSAIPSVVSKFTQESSDGSIGTGKFYLKRPGRMRWEYDPPQPMLLVSDGKTITYHDMTLNQVSYIGIDDTLASFLIRKQIKLDNDTFKLISIAKSDEQMRVTVVQRKKPAEGKLTLVFKREPLEIQRILTTDATGNETRVTLKGAQFGPVLEDSLFVFNDTRPVNDKRNRVKRVQ